MFAEPENANEVDASCWDADDDNLLLEEIKLTKTLKGICFI